MVDNNEQCYKHYPDYRWNGRPDGWRYEGQTKDDEIIRRGSGKKLLKTSKNLNPGRAFQAYKRLGESGQF